MRIRLCVFICSCLLALGLIGCTSPEETSATLSPTKTYGEAAANKTAAVAVKENAVLENSAAVVPVRDPFNPLIAASPPSDNQTDKGIGSSAAKNSNAGGSQTDTGQKISSELISVYQEGNKAYASLKDGKLQAVVAVGDTFYGYEITGIDIENNQVTLKKGEQIIVLKISSPTK
jgi:hypothetical protein